MGNNINQIAKETNIDKRVSEKHLNLFLAQLKLYVEESKQDRKIIKEANSILMNRHVEKEKFWE